MRGGLSAISSITSTASRVLPTRVGVRLRYGRPTIYRLRTPHPWGSAQGVDCAEGALDALPADLGVYPSPARTRPLCPRLPRARGSLSFWIMITTTRTMSSPHPWGSVLQPEALPPGLWGSVNLSPVDNDRLEMLPTHAWGSVVAAGAPVQFDGVFPPNMWGSVLLPDEDARCQHVLPTHVGVRPYLPAFLRAGEVFPTRVGVCPRDRRTATRPARLPRACVGLSASGRKAESTVRSSPRLRGLLAHWARQSSPQRVPRKAVALSIAREPAAGT